MHERLLRDLLSTGTVASQDVLISLMLKVHDESMDISTLRLAMSALADLNIALQYSIPGLKVQAVSKYSKALSELQRVLRNPRRLKNNEALTTVITLGQFEVRTPFLCQQPSLCSAGI